MTEPEFGRSFFDGGPEHAQAGCYASYTREEIGPYAEGLADFFVATFGPKTFLDVGCAKGFLVEAMLGRGVDAYGTDISVYAVEQSAVYPRLKTASLGQEPLPFSAQFDLVSCIGVLDYVQNLEAAVGELKRLTARCLVIEAGINKTGSGRIPRSMSDLEEAIVGTWRRNSPAEEAMLRVRQRVQFDGVLSHPRSMLSHLAAKVPSSLRPLLYWSYRRRAMWPAILILSPDSPAEKPAS